MRINKFVQLRQLNSMTIHMSNASHTHTYVDMRPQATTKALQDGVSQQKPSPTICPYMAEAPKLQNALQLFHRLSARPFHIHQFSQLNPPSHLTHTEEKRSPRPFSALMHRAAVLLGP